jgi:hypothetical protein
MDNFVIMDCALLMRMSGIQPAHNLRELRDRITVCSDDTLYHHCCETLLRTSFDDPEYRNDFAVWTKVHLSDKILAERLGIINPYEFESISSLRHHILEILEVRLHEVSPWVPTARMGSEFFFMEAVTVAFETGEVVTKPSDMAESVSEMTNGSIYFHYLEGLRRPPLLTDDFSAWFIRQGNVAEPYIRALGSIDFYFKTLASLREELASSLRRVEESVR